MDLKPTHKSPVLADPLPVNKSRLGMQSANMVQCPSSNASFSSSVLVSTPKKKLVPGKLEDVRSNGWLDAMISSSPPRKKPDKNHPNSGYQDDSVYNAWLLKYPSALTSFDQLTARAKGKRLALFLDYDGTLSPIVDNPERAFMSDEMREAVRQVAGCFPTAIISGRSRDKVYEFIGLTELYYAGSHGMDIMGPAISCKSGDGRPNSSESNDSKSKEVNIFQPAKKFIPMIDEVSRALVEHTKGIKGAKVENNTFCVSVHYRLVDEKNWPAVAEIVHRILQDYPSLRMTHGRKVLEVRPVTDWNKGKAVEFLLESLGLKDSNDVLPIYVGDDRTDEDAFKVLREGNRGHGILVSSVPKDSAAFYSLRDPAEVMEFLESLVEWRKSSLSQ